MRFIIPILFLIGIFFMPYAGGNAARVEDLRQQLGEKEDTIRQLEEEIRQYQKQIEETGKEASTFKTEIARLDAIIQKLQADIRLTQRKIDLSELTIEKLSGDINEKETAIKNDRVFLGELIREIDHSSSESLIEILLGHTSFADFFDDLQYANSVQGVIQVKLLELREVRSNLETEKNERETEKEKLETLAGELIDRNMIEKSARADKSYLLTATKQKESNYKKLLDERVKLKEALEAEIRALEQEIRVAIDPSSLPQTGSGVLGWPLQEILFASCWDKGVTSKNCVTQFFGNTDFATKNPQVYNGSGHNGVDFRAIIGESVFSSEKGVVRAVGDTDKDCRGVSYGKWILIDHPNNLSTLYAHLSNIAVSPGQQVFRGQRIGYSGKTGYSTGPHLHFTVFASKAVQITSKDPNAQYYYKSKICGTPLELPISAQNGYLNPLSYL